MQAPPILVAILAAIREMDARVDALNGKLDRIDMRMDELNRQLIDARADFNKQVHDATAELTTAIENLRIAPQAAAHEGAGDCDESEQNEYERQWWPEQGEN